ncbi:MAG: hypothetical protein AB1656_05090 [Candidatus Omnitrophota bacterium]
MRMSETRIASYPTLVALTPATGQSDFPKPVYGTAVSCFCRVEGSQRLNLRGEDALQRTDSRTFYFQPGWTLGSILTAAMTSASLAVGSLIAYDGANYKVEGVEPRRDECTDEAIEVIAYASYAGKAE